MQEPILKEGFVKRVGLIVGTPIAFNPTVEQIAKLTNRDESEIKDPRYEGETDEGEKTLRLDIWLQEKSGAKSRVKIYLKDKVQKAKNGKVKFIDKKGNLSFFVEDESKLKDFMRENDPWASRVGEYELYRFLQAYMSKVDRKKTENLTIDWDRLMRNDMKELNGLIGKPYTNDVLALLYVKADKKEGEVTEYQEVYNRNFLPADAIKYFKVKGEVRDFKVSTFIKEITDSEHGLKHFYGGILGEARPYEREENQVVTRLMNDTPFELDDEDDLTADYN